MANEVSKCQVIIMNSTAVTTRGFLVEIREGWRGSMSFLK